MFQTDANIYFSKKTCWGMVHFEHDTEKTKVKYNNLKSALHEAKPSKLFDK